MRFQFSTQQILLAAAFVAITCASLVAYRHIVSADLLATWGIIGRHFSSTVTLWSPVLFAMYAILHRTFTARLVLSFALIHLLALSITWGT